MVVGDPIAPIKHLCLSEPSADRDLDNHTLQKIADQVTLEITLYTESVFGFPQDRTNEIFSI